MRRLILVPALVLALGLAACGEPANTGDDTTANDNAAAEEAAPVENEADEAEDNSAEEEVDLDAPADATTSQAEADLTDPPTESTSVTDPAEPPSSNAAANDLDVTEDLTAGGEPWTEHVVTATQTEPDRVEVQTSIVDPRGDDGSPEAEQAIAVCNGTVAWLQAQGVAEPKVSVFEDDGTTFVVYGHPMYPDGECSET